VPQHEGCEPPLGRLQLPQGRFPRPTQVADGGIVDGGDGDRGEGSRAHAPGQLHGITPVGFDPITRLLGHQGGGDDPADGAFLHERALEPGTAGAGVVDEDTLRTLRPQGPEPLGTITLPRPDRAAGDDRRALGLGDRGDRQRLCMDIQANGERASL